MQQEDVEYAGFWIRVGASLIDTVLLMLILYPLLGFIYGWDYLIQENEGLFAGPADFLLSWVAPAVAVIVFWMYRQATPGKMALSIRIIDEETGGPPTTGQCIGRYFAYFAAMLPVMLGILWVAFDRRKQGWHDKLAGTLVVRARKRRPGRSDEMP